LNDNSNDQLSAKLTDAPPPDERTARLLEQLLQIARMSALEEMASGFAHEINQPIGAIATFAQAAKRMLSRPEPMIGSAVEVLDHISNEALNAGEGIRRIRGLFEGQPATRITCQLADVIFELRPVLDLLAARAGVTLEIAVHPDLPAVSIDRLRIQHVLFALVQNAFEAPRRVDAAPDIRVEVTSDRYAVITAVIDRGAGIPPAAHENLFRPFFTTKHNGTGLGLASSRAIIEAHEGMIGFDVSESGGTRFWFRLPVVVDAP
jgi:two-component system sensor kinase FixL